MTLGLQAEQPDARRLSPWTIMAPVKGQVRIAIALSVLSCACGLGALACLALAFGAVLDYPFPTPWSLANRSWWPLAGALAATIAAYRLRLAAFDQSHFAAFRLERMIRERLAGHLARLSLGQVEAAGTGALTKILHDDVKELHVFVADSTPLYARAFAMPVLTFCALVWLDGRLALAAAAVLALGLGVLALAMRDHAEMTRRYNAAREHVSTAVVEYVQAMPVVRAFDGGQATFGRYQLALDAYREVLVTWYRAASFTARFSLAVLGPLPTLAVLLAVGLVLLRQGSLDFTTFLAVLLLGTGMAEALMPLMMLNHMVEKAKRSIARIMQVLDLPEQPVDAGAQMRPAHASIAFEHVQFRYGAQDAEALHDVSFVARPGTVTALVGPSGAGKSTVVRLIPRFWDPAAGRVLVGGADVRRMDPDTLMAHLSFVFQDTFLFAGSIADNIRLGRPQADLKDVIAAARAAQAHDFISALPQGYDTRVGERGAFLSGGQRQRLTIARAILQDRPILILDEATAFADPESEAALVAALAALVRGRTVIVAAHRLATVRDADQIIVLDRGRMIECGDHSSLVSQGGVYARLWREHERASGWVLQGAPREEAVP